MDNTALFFLIFGLSNHSPLADSLMIFGARFIIYLAFLLMFILVFKGSNKERRASLLILVCLPIIIILIKLIHIFFFEPRPFISYNFIPLIQYGPDASFPSRHASIMGAIAFSYLYYRSKWSIIFLLLLFWVGISRIYVGVHYPIDILGGVIVGIISTVIAKLILNSLRAKLFR